MRKRLGRKKLLKKIKAIGQKERNKVNNLLHEISKEIVKWAEKTKSIIVLGNLKGIRKSAKGKVLRRLINSFPFYKLTKMIQYKALQKGLQVFRVKEYNTSKLCHNCGNMGKRINQASFSCSHCDLQYNADLNAARNILNRAREQGFLVRAMACAQKITPSD
ncbi:MAG: transposase [archaeon]